MPILLLLPVVALICVVCALRFSGIVRWLLLGSAIVLMGVWTWYVAAIAMLSLPD